MMTQTQNEFATVTAKATSERRDHRGRLTALSVPLAPRGRRPRHRAEAGQSAIIAIIVLFLLLFLGAIFIALIANNLRGTQRAANVSSSGRYAEAGINYLDQQLTTSPEGADWRPVPDSIIDRSDPDYYWLQPYRIDPATGQPIGGFTRINFGATGVAGGGATGGRALVRITYRPDAPGTANPDGTVTGGAVVLGSTLVRPAATSQPINRYLKLESVGRAGQVVANDPTTYGNSQALGLRVEQVAYKAIGLNEYVRQALNKDNKPVTASLGAPAPVVDRGRGREIETVIEGPVRFNTNLSFYGVNRFVLDPTRNDAIEVAGKISLRGVSDTATTTNPSDQTRVYVNLPIVKNAQGADTTAGNVLPSDSSQFTTAAPPAVGAGGAVPGLVRDNPRGSETQTITDADVANRNLRSVARTQPPLIDAPIGPNGLTRYRALTRDSAPLAPRFVTANDVNDPASGLGPYAGQYGWGQGLYLNNPMHLQAESETLAGGRSLRAEWLNPDLKLAGSSWVGDKYEPPAVTIILTPRYMILRRSLAPNASRNFFFRSPVTGGGVNAGQRLPTTEIIRYTAVNGAGAPAAGLSADTRKYEGYPAELPGALRPPFTSATGPEHGNSFKGEFVVFAEGNVRVRGVVGGLDPETRAYFRRHLTIVSGGNIYIDGNLLRDNISPDDTSNGANEVRGRSTLALLAKQNVVVNTTQFLLPDASESIESEAQNERAPYSRILSPGKPEAVFSLSFGPEDANNTPPRYLTRAGGVGTDVPAPALFLRHGPYQTTDARTFLRIGVNEQQPTDAGAVDGSTIIRRNYNYLDFGAIPAGYGDPADTTTLLLQSANYDAGANPTTVPSLYDQRFLIDPNFLFGVGTQRYPYSNANPVTLIGQENVIRLQLATDHFAGAPPSNYRNTRIGVAPLDIRVEALMYAQEGSFFIIPGPWMNPDPNDTYERYLAGEPGTERAGRRAGENAKQGATPRIDHFWPFHREPMDIRMTFFGAITENLPAEIGDQGAWLEKWGWVPDYFGSTGLTADPDFPNSPAAQQTVHGRLGYLRYSPDSALGRADTSAPGEPRGGNGILYSFDPRALAPYTATTGGAFTPVRPNPYFPDQPLPIVPRLPVAPGLLFYGQQTDLPR